MPLTSFKVDVDTAERSNSMENRTVKRLPELKIEKENASEIDIQ